MKVDNKTIEKTSRIIASHMFDIDLKTGQKKVQKFILKNADILDEILMLKQADFKASAESQNVCPTVEKWQEIFKQMQQSHVPFTVKELCICASDLMEIGFKGEAIGKQLCKLLELCQDYPQKNNAQTLKEISQKAFESMAK